MRHNLVEGEGIRWPNGSKAAVMITFDFDAESLQIARFAATGNDIIFADRSRGEYGPTEGIHRCLAMLERQGVRGTFFIPGYVLEKYPEQVGLVAAAGHEIAYHGYRHDAWTKRLTWDEETYNMDKAEALILAAAGKKPAGHRAPGGFMQEYAVEMLVGRGYKYSSNVNPKKCCDWAYLHELNGQSVPLVEFCTDCMLEDMPYFYFSLCKPEHKTLYDNDYVYEIWRDEYDGRAEEGDKFLCLKLHPSIIGRASRIRMVERFVAYMKERGAWIATCEEVADYVLAQNNTKA